LAPAQLLETLRPFHQEASACFAQASAEAAEGGRLVLHFRVGPDGAVQAACAREDDLGDPALRRCVVSRLSALRFPAPDPPGHVDAALPLVFRPDRSAAPRALCP
ncbi:MAG TPA: AgmX/PglI C-terminal domain-containing protein, partial [Polyangiaceae bacterium LLY-WYZ-15_(1-7)]|nr:AgmX/PglI C-terminal domain-containing protein [Polyangiaceae bacterium LLY-WYZ-15_(1-7)]